MTAREVWCIPNLLSLSRIPLAVVLCLCIDRHWWLAGLLTFVVAALTDWLDGWWARKYGPMTLLGRNLDPLTDKVLIASGFVFLIPEPSTGIQPWMVAIVVIREILITGLRGIVEAQGTKFPADWFGKLKTVLQCAVLIGVLLVQTLIQNELWKDSVSTFEIITMILLYTMLAATVGSAIQYGIRAFRLLK